MKQWLLEKQGQLRLFSRLMFILISLIPTNAFSEKTVYRHIWTDENSITHISYYDTDILITKDKEGTTYYSRLSDILPRNNPVKENIVDIEIIIHEDKTIISIPILQNPSNSLIKHKK